MPSRATVRRSRVLLHGCGALHRNCTAFDASDLPLCEQRALAHYLEDHFRAHTDQLPPARFITMTGDFIVKQVDDPDSGNLVLCGPEFTAEYRRRFDASMAASLTDAAAAGPRARGAPAYSSRQEEELQVEAIVRDSSDFRSIPGEGGTFAPGPLHTTSASSMAGNHEDPITSFMFPIFTPSSSRRANLSASSGEDAGGEAQQPSRESTPPPTAVSHYDPASEAALLRARHRTASAGNDDCRPDGGSGAAAGSGPPPAVMLYTHGQLQTYATLLGNAVITKFQHYATPWDWRRAVVVRLIGPTGRTAEIRSFAMMRLGSFPCFRCHMVWAESSWRDGDTLANQHAEDPHSVKELFACGYGRVEMDIRPRFDRGEFAKLASCLQLHAAFPPELLWNVLVGACLGNLLAEHVTYINMQYRTTIRQALIREIGL